MSFAQFACKKNRLRFSLLTTKFECSKLTSNCHVGIERSQLSVSGVGHEKVAEELDRPDARRRPDAHDSVKDNRTTQVVTQIGQKSFTVNVQLKVGVLVQLTASQTTNL